MRLASVASRSLAAAAVAVLAWAPTLARACPVCFDPSEQNRSAWVGTTIFLSLLPLAMIGGLSYYLYRRAREA